MDAVERWASIEEAPAYEVSSEGRVRKIGSLRDRVQSMSACGYVQLNLKCADGATRTFRTHRMVAKYFVQNPFGMPEVNHLSGDKFDNSALNLEWCSAKQNSEHSVRVLGNGRGEKNGHSKLTTAQVEQVRAASGSYKAIAAQFKISANQVSQIRKGRSWTHVEASTLGRRVRSKLCPETIDAIRGLEGSQSSIAILFGVSQSHVSRIKRGVSGQNLPC